MELRIKPASASKYAKRALLIKGAAPVLWLRELEALKVNVNEIEAFAIPSDRANVLYGCLLVFNQGLPKDTRNHKCFQCAYNKIFIPENATLYPQLTPADIASVKASWIIAHPDFGFVDLEAPIDWLDLIAEVPETELQVRQPLEGIAVPDKILGCSVEMDEDDIEKALLPQKTEEEWMKDLPFNLQKVLEGNKKEAEKYLQYLAKYPERALALGIPLDVMNTSRDKGWASLNFRSGWLQSLFGSGFSGGFMGGGGGAGGGNSGGYSGNSYSGGSFRNRLQSVWIVLRLVAVVVFILMFLARIFDSGYNKAPSMDYKITRAQTDSLRKNFEKIMAAAEKDTAAQPVAGDTLENLQKALRSKHTAAVYKYGSREVQLNKALKDSIRLQMNELEQQMNKVSQQIAARDASIRKDKLKQVEAELTKAEMRLDAKIRDSIAKLPQQAIQTGTARDNLYQLALESKKASLRDSLERAYGIRTAPQETVLPRAPESPAYTASAKTPVTFTRFLLLLSGLLGGVIIFAKIIKRKTISMGGQQLSAGVKILLLLILVTLLAYILYPLVARYGYNNGFVWLMLLAVGALLYRLLASDKTILKSDKNG